MHHIAIRGHKLEYVRLASAHPRPHAPAMVFLHEGLGCIAMWRDFPQRLADACGCEAIVYSRHGYGRSDPFLTPRAPGYMHDEALLALPELLDRLEIDRPFLFGHSDGASIALIHAGGSARPIRGAIVVAPHVMVEDIALENIAKAGLAYRTTQFRTRLAHYHAHVDPMFVAWHDTWLAPEFRAWNIESYLPAITAPILAIQGVDDEYGTLEQLERIARQSRDVEMVTLADCRHSPHKDQPEAVISAVTGFIARILD